MMSYAREIKMNSKAAFSYGHPTIGWPARSYIHHLCVDTGCSLKDLPRVIDDWDGWREREGKRESSKSML